MTDRDCQEFSRKCPKKPCDTVEKCGAKACITKVCTEKECEVQYCRTTWVKECRKVREYRWVPKKEFFCKNKTWCEEKKCDDSCSVPKDTSCSGEEKKKKKRKNRKHAKKEECGKKEEHCKESSSSSCSKKEEH